MKVNIEYTIGKGNKSQLNGTIEIVLLYGISIQNDVIFQYTCPQKKAQIYQIVATNKNDITVQSIYGFISLWNNLVLNIRTNKNQNIAQNNEK